MNVIMNKKYLLKILLLIWLPNSLTLAYTVVDNNEKNKNFSWKHTRINLEAGGGWSYGPIFPIFKIGTTKNEVGISRSDDLNFSLGALAVYNFSSLPTQKIKPGLEFGIIYPFPRTIEIKRFNIIFREQHIKFPFYLTVCWRPSSYFAYSWVLGYELEYILSSQYKQYGYYPDLPASMCGNKNIKNILPDTPKFWNNFISTMRFEFSKGIYLEIKLTITPALAKFTTQEYYDKNHELDNMFITLTRALTAPLSELKLGVNVMDWFFPKERLPNYTTSH